MDQDRPPPRMLYHIATAADWAQAQRDGEYRISTRGRTLAEEGFIHTSTASQVIPVANAFYRDEPAHLLLLVLDPARIGAEIRWDQVPGSAEPFPHIYGPLPVAAVRQAVPFERDESGQFRFPAGAAGHSILSSFAVGCFATYLVLNRGYHPGRMRRLPE